MIPKVIHQTAPSKQISPEEKRMRRRIMRLLPDWELNLWDDDDNSRFVAQAFPQYHGIYTAIRRGVVKADIARCVYLYLFGGWYLDTDYKLLRPLDNGMLMHSLILPVSGTEADLHLVCNSVIASEAGHPFWADFLAEVFADPRLVGLEELNVEATTGPLGLSRFYLKNKEKYGEIYLPAKEFFHPRVTCRGLLYDRHTVSYGAHLCWGSWKSKSPVISVKNYVTRKVTSYI